MCSWKFRSGPVSQQMMHMVLSVCSYSSNGILWLTAVSPCQACRIRTFRGCAKIWELRFCVGFNSRIQMCGMSSLSSNWLKSRLCATSFSELIATTPRFKLRSHLAIAPISDPKHADVQLLSSPFCFNFSCPLLNWWMWQLPILWQGDPAVSLFCVCLNVQRIHYTVPGAPQGWKHSNLKIQLNKNHVLLSWKLCIGPVCNHCRCHECHILKF